jgi:hypothetical protein
MSVSRSRSRSVATSAISTRCPIARGTLHRPIVARSRHGAHLRAEAGAWAEDVFDVIAALDDLVDSCRRPSRE